MSHLNEIEIEKITSNIKENINIPLNRQNHLLTCDFCSRLLMETAFFDINFSKYIKAAVSPKQKKFIKKIISKLL